MKSLPIILALFFFLISIVCGEEVLDARVRFAKCAERLATREKGLSLLATILAKQTKDRSSIFAQLPEGKVNRKCSTESRIRDVRSKEELDVSFDFFCFQFDQAEKLIQIEYFANLLWKHP